jgi:alpha-tubulin suppressor-like RCC1 family protein
VAAILLLALLITSGGIMGSAQPASAAAGPSPVHSISNAADHSCAIRSNGSVACWGNNSYGQAPSDCATSAVSPCYGQFTQISATMSTSCGIRNDGSISCWGSNGWGQAPHDCATNTGQACHGQFVQIAVGETHSCAIRTDATIACWGVNDYGEAPADCTTNNADACHGSFAQISVGSYTTCGLRTDHTIACWGYAAYGNAPADCATNPAAACHGAFASVSMSGVSTCGITVNLAIACWGSDSTGNAPTDCATKTAERCYGAYASVAVGDDGSCGIKVDGAVACWGYTSSGESPDCAAPGAPCLGQFHQLAAGQSTVCGIRADRTISCWGPTNSGAPHDCGSNASDACYGKFGPLTSNLRFGHDGGTPGSLMGAPAGANGVDLIVKYRATPSCSKGAVKPAVRLTWNQAGKAVSSTAAPCNAKKKLFSNQISFGWNASGNLVAPAWVAGKTAMGMPPGFSAGDDGVLINLCPYSKSHCGSTKSTVVAKLWWTENGAHLQRVAVRNGTNQILFEGFPAT